jgi:hypothetical protein
MLSTIAVIVTTDKGSTKGSFMSAIVTKSKLVEAIREVFVPILDRQVEERTIADASHKDTLLVDLCRGLVSDVEWMFRYTGDGETWTHVDDLALTSPFPTLLSVDTVASDGVPNFLYERAERYFKQSYIRTNELDWFYLDFVVTVGYRVLVKEYGDKAFKTAYPAIYQALEEYDGRNIWALVKYAVIGLVKNTFIFGLVIFLVLVANEGQTWAGFLGGGLLVWKLYSWFSQSKLYSRLKDKSFEKLTHYSAMYNLFSDGYVRWDMLGHDIKRLRDLSIEFPLVLGTALIERKK